MEIALFSKLSPNLWRWKPPFQPCNTQIHGNQSQSPSHFIPCLLASSFSLFSLATPHLSLVSLGLYGPPPYPSSPLLSTFIFHALSLPLDLQSPFLHCLISFIALSSLSIFLCRVVPSLAPSSLECSGLKSTSFRGVKHFPLARSRLQFGSPYGFCGKQYVSSPLILPRPRFFRCSTFSSAYHFRHRRREHSRSPVAGPSPYSFSRERKGGSCSLLPMLVYFPLSFANSCLFRLPLRR